MRVNGKHSDSCIPKAWLSAFCHGQNLISLKELNMNISKRGLNSVDINLLQPFAVFDLGHNRLPK